MAVFDGRVLPNRRSLKDTILGGKRRCAVSAFGRIPDRNVKVCVASLGRNWDAGKPDILCGKCLWGKAAHIRSATRVFFSVMRASPFDKVDAPVFLLG